VSERPLARVPVVGYYRYSVVRVEDDGIEQIKADARAAGWSGPVFGSVRAEPILRT
jgi:hypothetical protein